MHNALVNITVVTYNRLALTRRTLEAVLRHTREPYVLNVVDNGSQDGTRQHLLELKASGLIGNLFLFERNMGVACACNTGWAAAPADYYLKLDNDIETLHEGWLANLVQFFRVQQNTGSVAYRVIPDDQRPAYHVGRTPVFLPEFCGGACLMTSGEVLAELGGFCEDYGIYGEEDADFGARVAMTGRQNVLVDGAGHVRHNEDPGYERDMAQCKSRLARRKNIEQFQSNVHFYDTGLRPLYVSRRYISERRGDLYTCTLCEQYKRQAIAWNRYRKVVCYATQHIIGGYVEENTA